MMLHRRWESATRYYAAMVQRDLFGDMEVLQVWGGKGNRLGGSKKLLTAGTEEAFALVEKIGQRRLARGTWPCLARCWRGQSNRNAVVKNFAINLSE
jgi:hypothetical protein